MLCATNQAAYLLKRQLESQGKMFLEAWGIHGETLRDQNPAKKVGLV